METKVQKTIDKFSMFNNVENVIVGLSGGADSVALTHLLIKLSKKYGFKVIATHINHNLRGEEANRDENFVRDFCKNHEIKLEVLSVDLKKEAQNSNEGTEECGRRIRYDFFEKIASSYTSSKIATAHTLSDNIETVLFNLTRGTALNGLCGIMPVRDNIIRPLIDCTREEIENYCEKNNVDFVVDSTNLTQIYTRNKLRHSVVPVLYDINKGLDKTFSGMINSLNVDNDYFKELSKLEFEKSIKNDVYDVLNLKTLHEAVLNRVLMLILKKETKLSPSRILIDKLKKVIYHGGKIQLSGQTMARVRKNQLEIYIQSIENEEYEKNIIVGINLIKHGILKVIEYNARNIDFNEKINKNLLKNALDCDKISGKMFVRFRKNGDSYTIFSRNCSKSLKKLFNESGVCPEKRDSIPVLCDEKGIIWVNGFGVDERVKVCENSKKIFLVDYTEN